MKCFFNQTLITINNQLLFLFILGDNPYPNVNIQDVRYLVLHEDLRLNRPEYATDEIFDILKDCQRDDPIFRPTFDYLKNHLKTIAQNNKQILLTPTKTTNYRISDVPITPQPRSAFVQSPLYFHR